MLQKHNIKYIQFLMECVIEMLYEINYFALLFRV